jgi:hypothetical protein
MDLDRIAYEGNSHPKRQHRGDHEANAQPQAELDIPKYQPRSCHAVASEHAITLFDFVFRHVAGDDGGNGTEKGY